MSLNLPHRHACYNPENPAFVDVYDDMHVMLERLEAITHLLQGNFIDGDDSGLSNGVIFCGLDSILMESRDIKEMLHHYLESQAKQLQKKPV